MGKVSKIEVSVTWPTVSYCVTSGTIQIARYQRGPGTDRKLVIVEITPQEIEKVINDLEIAAIMAQEAA